MPQKYVDEINARDEEMKLMYEKLDFASLLPPEINDDNASADES